MTTPLLSIFLFSLSGSLELLVVVALVLAQLWVAQRTYRQIVKFRGVIPDREEFRLRDRWASAETLHLDPLKLVRNIDENTSVLELPEHTKITYIHTDNSDNESFTRIQESINSYLVRNKGAIADFNILRDITQRNLDAEEDAITIMLPLPLYLGLLGTMIGVVIGLFSMPTLEIRSFNDGEGNSNLNGVSALIEGVKYAMLASATGLLITIINSWIYRDAKTQIERRKQDFFTFLQTHLLPILTENVNSGILNLNRSFNTFGQKFNQMATRFEQSVAQNYQSLAMQKDLLKQIQQIDPARVATYNVKVMTELRSSMSSLERFAEFLGTLTTLTNNTKQLVERTQDVQQLTTQFNQLLTESQALQRFLASHFDKIEQSGQVVNNAVVKVDEVVNESLDSLAEHINERIEAVRKITLTEDNLLIEAFERNREPLKHLRHLESLHKDVTTLNTKTDQGQQALRVVLTSISNSLQEINRSIEKQNQVSENFIIKFWKKLNNRA